MYEPRLSELADRDGMVFAGWLEQDVLYARFEGMVSASLGQRFAVRLGAFSRQSEGIRYFTDMHRVTSYDLLARSALVQVVMAHRARFRCITTLVWAGGITASGHAVAAAMGVPIDYVATLDDFEGRLSLIAPLALTQLAASARAPSSSRQPRII